MKIQIRANQTQQQILLQKNIAANAQIVWHTTTVDETADAYVDLLFEDEPAAFKHIANKPVLVNLVLNNCSDLKQNFCRINGWNTFLEKQKIEIATSNKSSTDEFKNVLETIGFTACSVNDLIGFISMRSIAMIINEAYFGLQDEISSKSDIDTAMKLGTNYPYGPFEWAEKIGVYKIATLLTELSKTDERYEPCNLLMKEAGFNAKAM